MTRLLFLVLLLASCGNPCLDMCQQYELYLDRCGYGWSTAFPDQDWASIDDCYDTYWDAAEQSFGTCEAEIKDYAQRNCY